MISCLRMASGFGPWLATAIVLWFVQLAHPQTTPDALVRAGGSDRRPIAITARFGWDDSMPAERFAPIWITIDPGARALDGAVSLTLPQDAVQEVRLITPFAAAPGRPATVEFAASLPATASRCTVEVRDRTGRVVASQVWAPSPTSRQLMFPPGLFLYDDELVSVGVESLPIAARAWSPGLGPVPTRQISTWGGGSSPQVNDLFRHVHVVDMPPAQLPTAWIAYDSLRCLVLDAEATPLIPPAAVQAIKDWVSDGGRLVLIADEPGSAWVEWLAGQPGTDPTEGSEQSWLPIQLGELASLAPPAALSRAATEAVRPEGEPGQLDLKRRLGVRPAMIEPRGRAMGWRTHWELDAAPESDTGEAGGSAPRSALIAEGPVGLGFVCVVGFDPADVVLGADRAATAAIWKHVLAGALAPFAPDQDRRDVTPGWFGQLGSGDHGPARAGMTAGLDYLADVPVPSGGVFYLIVGACLGLALLIGPVDAALRKRLGLRPEASWLRALACIGLASAAAYIIPGIGREGAGRLGRLCVVDQIHDSRGMARFSRQTALTGIFSARAGAATISDDDAAAWWRGVSTVSTFYYGRQPRITSQPITLTVADIQRRAGGSDPGLRPPVATGSLGRSGLPRSIPMPMNTFRTLMERGVGSLPLGVIASARPDGGWTISIAGLPEQGRITMAQLAIGEQEFDLNFTLEPVSEHQVATSGLARDRTKPNPAWREVVAGLPGELRSGYSPPRAAGALERMPGQALRLMGPDDRSDALDRLRAAGDWAILYLMIQGVPIDARTTAAQGTSRTVIARLALPIATEPSPGIESPGRASGLPPRWIPPNLPLETPDSEATGAGVPSARAIPGAGSTPPDAPAPATAPPPASSPENPRR